MRIIIVLLFCVIAFSTVETYSQEGMKPEENTDFLKELGLEMLEYPDDVRANLKVPEKLWELVKARTGHADKDLGYTEEEMYYFKTGTKHIMPVVDRLFRDVRKLPALSGSASDYILAQQNSPSQMFYYLFRFHGVRAAFWSKPPTPKTWGVDWLSDDVKPADALLAVLKHGVKNHENTVLSKENEKVWKKFPEHLQKFIIRIMITHIELNPWIEQAFPRKYLAQALDKKVEEITMQDVYELVSHPWQKNGPNYYAFDALNRIDFAYLGFATIMYHKYLEAAIKEYDAAEESMDSATDEEKTNMQTEYLFGMIEFDTACGKVAIYDSGKNEITEEAAIILDLGGDDKYSGVKATPLNLKQPLATLIDLGGNDEYKSTKESATLACGLMGASALIDCSGNDKYECADSGLGSAWYGTSLLWDKAGDDSYITLGSGGQGAAHVGIGICLDSSGNDKYFCHSESQGFGSTLGIGVIVDISGNDYYKVSDTENISAAFHDRAISFSQGAAFGRRADLGDGQSLAGGVGLLVEGAGDDVYWGSVYAQGAGYWWAVGMLEDRAGNDSYRYRQYSCGSAPHMAMGCVVDLKGDDKYNKLGKDVAYYQHHSCARDGSFAVFIDGSGNDEYHHHNRCGGSAEINSIALFWDRLGNDVYNSYLEQYSRGTPPWGYGIFEKKYNSFRDDMACVGVFLDTNGKDDFRIKITEKSSKPKAKENSIWGNERLPVTFGLGLDVNLYKEKPEETTPESSEESK
ncbi:MAG: hypothetical protein K8S87_01410 [Planctomycetes bacterium]|nr:hypothetical protein [Planctomycetota bacterium]